MKVYCQLSPSHVALHTAHGVQVNIKAMLTLVCFLLSLTTLMVMSQDVAVLETSPQKQDNGGDMTKYTAHFPNAIKKKSISNCEVVHLVINCLDSESTEHIDGLLQTLLWHRTVELSVHFVVNNKTKDFVEKILKSKDPAKVYVMYYTVEHPADQTISAAFEAVMDAKKYTDKMIYLNPRMRLAADIWILWKEFTNFHIRQGVGMVRLPRKDKDQRAIYHYQMMLIDFSKIVASDFVVELSKRNPLSEVEMQDFLLDMDQFIYGIPCLWSYNPIAPNPDQCEIKSPAKGIYIPQNASPFQGLHDMPSISKELFGHSDHNKLYLSPNLTCLDR